jgi:hypothetical protein
VDPLRELYFRLLELEALWADEALQTFAGGKAEIGKLEIARLKFIVIDAIGERDHQRLKDRTYFTLNDE